MLWRIQISEGPLAWMEVGTGKLFDDNGQQITYAVGYTPTDTAPAQPEWYVEPTPVATQSSLLWSDPNLDRQYFWIDVGPFFDRFGAKALAVTSSQDAQVQGFVTLILPRQYIDLKRADLPQMVGLLAMKGLITAGEMTSILNPVTTEYERHVKGLQQPE